MHLLTQLSNRSKETFITLEGKPEKWVRTGDEVMFNEKAEIFVLDRLKVGSRLSTRNQFLTE